MKFKQQGKCIQQETKKRIQSQVRHENIKECLRNDKQTEVLSEEVDYTEN